MLRCEECAKEARTGEEARGWRTLLIVVEEGKPAEPVHYLPRLRQAGIHARRGLTKSFGHEHPQGEGES